MADTNQYLQCLDANKDGVRASVQFASREQTLQEENDVIQRHNAAVEEMEKVASAFNNAVAEFESRQK